MGLNTGKNDKAGKQRTATGRPRPLNRGGGVIEATKAALYGLKIGILKAGTLIKLAA